MPNLPLLLNLLSYCRPVDSVTDEYFCSRFIAPHTTRDQYGNWHATVPCADGSPSPIVWSCHTDTVHHTAGRQTVAYDPLTQVVTLSRRARRDGRNCLGADDTAGVYLCLRLLAARVPGHYIFHYGEEGGGRGSSALAHHAPKWLEHATIAIAFDRRGTDDVITHQSSLRCASDLFGQSLADALNARETRFDYRPSDHGVYTDTAEYPELVAECVNLSVGYDLEHTPYESLDVDHLFRLERAIIGLDTSALVVDREPHDPNTDPWDDDPNQWRNWWTRHEHTDAYREAQADLVERFRLASSICDWCGAVTFGDDTHDCPYFTDPRRI